MLRLLLILSSDPRTKAQIRRTDVRRQNKENTTHTSSPRGCDTISPLERCNHRFVVDCPTCAIFLLPMRLPFFDGTERVLVRTGPFERRILTNTWDLSQMAAVSCPCEMCTHPQSYHTFHGGEYYFIQRGAKTDMNNFYFRPPLSIQRFL